MSASFPLPDIGNPRIGPFYEAAGRQELSLPRCSACDRFNWYPPETCRYCGGDELPWSTVSGRGHLFSWTVVARAFVPHFSNRVPYIPALISVEEAPEVRIVSNVVECDAGDLEIDMPMRVVFRDVEFPDVEGRFVAPFFVPVVRGGK